MVTAASAVQNPAIVCAVVVGLLLILSVFSKYWNNPLGDQVASTEQALAGVLQDQGIAMMHRAKLERSALNRLILATAASVNLHDSARVRALPDNMTDQAAQLFQSSYDELKKIASVFASDKPPIFV